MTTLEKIKMDGLAAMEKAGRGEVLSTNDAEVLKIYSSLYAKKAGNAGKRKIVKTGR
jgi:hypothetical protein